MAILALVITGACQSATPQPAAPSSSAATSATASAPKADPQPAAHRPRDFKVVHVYVALCDNKNQGIVKVSESLGNGQKPAVNLYWGAMYGVKTFFSKSPQWTAVASRTPAASPAVLERVVFRSKAAPTVIVVADAYDGAKMREALTDFLSAASGRGIVEVDAGGTAVQAGGLSDLVAFVGHNGLMDMQLAETPERAGPNPAGAVVLACKSRAYFLEPLRKAGCPALVTTTQLMAPEAYTLDAIIRSFAAGEAAETVARRAAAAYAAYQKCTVAAAEKMFAAGY
jgi:hypothetical protein